MIVLFVDDVAAEYPASIDEAKRLAVTYIQSKNKLRIESGSAMERMLVLTYCHEDGTWLESNTQGKPELPSSQRV